MYGVGIFKGMWVTLRHLFRPPITEQYPEQRIKLAPRFRGFDFAWDIERCTGCASCAKACPHGVIKIETSPGPGGKYNIDRFDIDRAVCMFCALCVEACPYEALHMGSQYECAVYHYEDLYLTKEQLIQQWYTQQTKDPARLPSAYARPQFEIGRREFPHVPKVGGVPDKEPALLVMGRE